MHAHHALLNLFVVVSTNVTPTRHTGWHDNLCYTSARLFPAERYYLSASHRMCVQITQVAFYAFLTTRMLQTVQSRVFDFSLFLALKIRCALHLQACRDWVITVCPSLILQRFSRAPISVFAIQPFKSPNHQNSGTSSQCWNQWHSIMRQDSRLATATSRENAGGILNYWVYL